MIIKLGLYRVQRHEASSEKAKTPMWARADHFYCIEFKGVYQSGSQDKHGGLNASLSDLRSQLLVQFVEVESDADWGRGSIRTPVELCLSCTGFKYRRSSTQHLVCFSSISAFGALQLFLWDVSSRLQVYDLNLVPESDILYAAIRIWIQLQRVPVLVVR